MTFRRHDDDARAPYHTSPTALSNPPAPQGFDAALYDAIASMIARNVESLERVPRTVLPEHPARHYLAALARAGHDCYAYFSGGRRSHTEPQGELVGTNGSWCLWIEPLARITNGRDGRVPITLWLQTWQWLVPAIHCAIHHTSARGSGPLSQGANQ